MPHRAVFLGDDARRQGGTRVVASGQHSVPVGPNCGEGCDVRKRHLMTAAGRHVGWCRGAAAGAWADQRARALRAVLTFM